MDKKGQSLQSRTFSKKASDVRKCDCVQCDSKSREEYEKMRFPDGMIDWNKLEDKITDPRMTRKEGSCTSDKSIDDFSECQGQKSDANVEKKGDTDVVDITEN